MVLFRLRRFISVVCLGWAAILAFDLGSDRSAYVPMHRAEQRLIGEGRTRPVADVAVRAKALPPMTPVTSPLSLGPAGEEALERFRFDDVGQRLFAAPPVLGAIALPERRRR